MKLFDFKNKLRRDFKKLVESDRYKNSKYRIEKINGYYAIKNTNTSHYVDLYNMGYEWIYGTTYTNDCLGTIRQIIRTFDRLCPIIEPLNIEEIF